MLWVRGGRYWTCDGEACVGAIPSPIRPTCILCPNPMSLRYGENGRHRERWYFFCDQHVTPDAGLKLTRPADPRSLHHKRPRGWAK